MNSESRDQLTGLTGQGRVKRRGFRMAMKSIFVDSYDIASGERFKLK